MFSSLVLFSCGRAATVVFGDCFSSPSCLRFLPFFRPAKLNQPLICAAKRNKGLQGRTKTNTCVCFTLLQWCKYCFCAVLHFASAGSKNRHLYPPLPPTQ